MSTAAPEILALSNVTRAGSWGAGFLVLGALLSSISPLLVTWNYHFDGNPITIGLHFLGLNAGYLAGTITGQIFFSNGRLSVRRLAIVGSALGALSQVGLYFLAPPAPAAGRIAALFLLGIACGWLASSLLWAGAVECARSLASTASRCGILFGSGCMLGAGLAGGAYLTEHSYAAPLCLAAVPALFLLSVMSRRWPAAFHQTDAGSGVSAEGRLLAGVLLMLLLFFQFGSEWALVGWLPLFLIRVLSASPSSAIFSLPLFFAVILAARTIGQQTIGRVKHGRLLLASTALAVAGYLILSLSVTLMEAQLGIVVTGLGLGPIYPLVSQYLDERFAFQPRFYNTLLTAGVSGAMLTPWILGYVAAWLSMRAVLLFPAASSVAVLLLGLLLMLESRLTGLPPLPCDTG